VHYFKRNIGDYHKKAGRLSIIEHGAYTLLMDACYDRERFPTLEEAMEWCWANSPEEIAAVEFVLNKFFILTDGIYVQLRIEEEIAAYHEMAINNKKIAQQREDKRRLNKHGAYTDRTRSVNEPYTERTQTVHEAPPNHKPLTNNQEPVVEVRHNPPTQREVEEYVKSIGFSLDCEKFITHYKSQGWILGNGIPMADWQETINKWKLSDMKKSKESSTDANFVKEV